MRTLDILALAAAAFALVAVIGVLAHEVVKNRGATEELAWYKKTYLFKQGWTKGFGNYDLRSFDGGQHWFNVVRTDGGGIVVTSPADPELIRHLDGWDALTKHVFAHGPLDLSKPSDVQLLTGAGFTVDRTDTSQA